MKAKKYFEQGQLERVKPDKTFVYAASMKLRGSDSGETHWLNLTHEQLAAVTKILVGEDTDEIQKDPPTG